MKITAVEPRHSALSIRRRQLPLPLLAIAALMLVCLQASPGYAATDPGPRGGAPGAGGPLPGLTRSQMQRFLAGQEAIQKLISVSGGIAGTGLGLGPRFNMDSCAGCHSAPAAGGSSPAVNPLIEAATRQGAANSIPFFVVADGPILRPFFINDSAQSKEKHLFTITGRTDAPGCNLAQPDFEAEASNLTFHIPLPLYGDGLIELIATSTLQANLAADGALKQSLGIAGHLGGNSGSGRFFWKGQGAGLPGISAAANLGDVGVTNALARKESDPDPACQFNALPEDKRVNGQPEYKKINDFITFSAGPTPLADTPSTASGRALFAAVGCALCHTPSLKTASSRTAVLSQKNAALFSDLALHRMGPGLADGVTQGNAAADEFRTPPLWGLGQRIFFLHDGRTKDLGDAISAHASGQGGTAPSEANAVIDQYNALAEEEQQDLLNFLRSL